jgi:hypothetical protein
MLWTQEAGDKSGQALRGSGFSIPSVLEQRFLLKFRKLEAAVMTHVSTVSVWEGSFNREKGDHDVNS